MRPKFIGGQGKLRLMQGGNGRFGSGSYGYTLIVTYLDSDEFITINLIRVDLGLLVN